MHSLVCLLFKQVVLSEQGGKLQKIVKRADCNKGEQGGIYLKFHKTSRLQLGMSRVLLKIILLLSLRFLL